MMVIKTLEDLEDNIEELINTSSVSNVLMDQVLTAFPFTEPALYEPDHTAGRIRDYRNYIMVLRVVKEVVDERKLNTKSS